MSSGNQVLGFAIRVANEGGDALREVKDQLGDIEEKAVDAGREVKGLGEKLADAGGNSEKFLTGTADLLGFGEQLGIQVGPIGEWAGGVAQAAGGLEAVVASGPAMVELVKNIPAMLGPAIATTWGYVSALLAQAAAFVVANAPLLLIIGGIALLALGVYGLIKHWDSITEKVPILGTAFDAVKDVVLGIKDKVIGAFQAVPDFLRDHWPEIATIISGPFAPLVILATDGFGIRSALIGAFGSMVGEVTGKVSEILEAGRALGSALKDGFIEGVKGTVAIASNIADGILGAIKYLINSAVDAINDLIPNSLGFDVGAFGVTKHISIPLPPNPIPHLANGGIVTQPTLALIGEAGPEAVVPLSGPNRPAGIGGMTVNVFAIDAQSFEEWLNRGGGDVIADHLSRRMAA